MRSALNNFILDGVDNNSYGTSNQGFSNQVVQVSPDAVEEFKVQTNNFSRRVRARRRRGDQRDLPQRHEPVSRHGLGVQPQHRRSTRPDTSAPAPASRRSIAISSAASSAGRSLRNRAFFFANYEGFRQVQRTVTFSSIPTAAQRQGIMGKAGGEPADRCGLRRRRDPAVGDHAVCRQGARRTAGADAARRQQQLRHAAPPPGLQRQVRHQVRSAAARRHQRVRPLQPSQGRQLRAAAAAGRDRQPGERVRRGAQSADGGGRDAHPVVATRCSKSGSASRGPTPGKTALGTGRPTCSRPMAFPACRPTRCSRAG